MDIKNDENFECILNGFLVALGANMAPKPSQNPSPRRCPLGVPLGSWRALGGLLGPLGAQEPILSIFDRFLIDFYRFVDRFLDDFWLIFLIVLDINSNQSNNNNTNNSGKNTLWKDSDTCKRELTSIRTSGPRDCHHPSKLKIDVQKVQAVLIYIVSDALALWRTVGAALDIYIYIYMYRDLYISTCIYI